MKAVVATKYGPPDVLQVQEVDKPAPTDSQLLVRVRAVSLNPAEWRMRRGMLLARVVTRAFSRPPEPMLAADFAGRVEAVGRDVSEYAVGDEVYGRRSPDGFAEYVCVSEKSIARKPANVTFEQAAAVPVAGLTALQSIRDNGQLRPGQKVLINGAAGGVGTFGVQIAKAFGAEVTGVCSPRNLELVRSLGADRVVDYTREDFTRSGQQYDLIIDNVGNRSLADQARVLRPGGICVIVGYTSLPLLFQHLVLARLISRMGSKRFGMMLARITHADLVVMNELMASGKVVPVVDRRYPLSQVVEAYRYVETLHARGKVVVTFDQESGPR
jgi:NADPH:quinone reductase-like Zn-dependent oxidoreductase